MTKPVLLLDVDGVLIPFREIIRRDLPDIFERLIQSFTLIWASANGFSANRHMLGIMGLEDPLYVIEFDHGVMTSGRSWKLPIIQEWAREDGRPCVWIDDEALEDATEWAAQRTEEGIPTLVIRTDPELGFTDQHLEDLETWAKEIAITT